MSLTFTTAATPEPTPADRRAELLADPGFGRYTTDHMVTVRWTRADGWRDARLRPYGRLDLDPAAAVLHYGQEVFEGLKAFRHRDGSIWAFRPQENAERLAASAARLALPVLPAEDFMESLRLLVTADREWVPPWEEGEKSLYLRPFMFASAPGLGIYPSDEVTYVVIASPSGPYFPTGLRPVALWLSETYARAGRGGTGSAKCGGNYAGSLAAQLEGAAHGCDQVVFPDAATRTYVDELGGMNIFFVLRSGDLVTPELTDSILPGITRRSILDIAPELGLRPVERRVEVAEWTQGVVTGEVSEVFACGTAAVVTPVGVLRWAGGEARTPATEVSCRIRERLLGIQKGVTPDTRGWMRRLL